MKKILTVGAYLLMICCAGAFLVWLEYVYSTYVAPVSRERQQLSGVIRGQHGVSGAIITHEQAASLWKGIDPDKQKLSKLRAEAAQGDADKQYQLAKRYLEGQGVSKNDRQAHRWLEKAAKQGHVPSQLALAQAYQDGEHVTRDLRQARKWFGEAAKNGSMQATYELGLIYYRGHDVAQNSIVAYSLMQMAARENQMEAQAERTARMIAAQMTPEQVEEADRLVSQLRTPANLLVRLDAAKPRTLSEK